MRPLATRQKIFLARMASAPVRLARRAIGLGEQVEVRRGGVRWRLDLREGIDLAIYLLGMFERSTVRAYERLVRPGDVALDIGANIGAHSLHLARLVGHQGRVVCFEPTAYAFDKLCRNVGLNPALAGSVTAERIMLADSVDAAVEPALFSSWPLQAAGDLHAKHRGRAQSTEGARATTIDAFLLEEGIARVHFVKMDVDGHECGVLRGASEMLRSHRPTIVMELSPHVLEETGHSVEELIELLGSAGYGLTELASGRPAPMDGAALRARIPDGTSLNVLARASDATISSPEGPAAPVCYTAARRDHWNRVARFTDRWSGWGGSYHRRLQKVYRSSVPPGQRVLELGSGLGDLLAALEPVFGVGVDFADEMLARAARRHPHLHFVNADVHDLRGLKGPFDVIILSDLINDLWDVQAVLEQLKPLMTSRTRLVFNLYSRLWQLPLELAQRLRLAKPLLPQNWLTVEDLLNLLRLTDLEAIRSWHECLLPLPVPLLAPFCNSFLVRLWPFNCLALSNFVAARRAAAGTSDEAAPLVSVIVPARNEEGNIGHIFERTPEMGRGTELVFVEGHSKDRTFEAIEEEIREHPERRAKLLRQPGIGKGDAVRHGFAAAAGEILMILDADLTVPPEDLPRFYQALRAGKGEFANGVRLVYPMEAQAMRFINLLGNKFFGVAFSWLLGQPIKDTLCGTKALFRADYDRIAANRSYFGDFDPFGDFDLLFGAAKLNLRIVEMPIRYRQRTYGTTNIQRWKHGWLLLRMVVFAARRIKFG